MRKVISECGCVVMAEKYKNILRLIFMCNLQHLGTVNFYIFVIKMNVRRL